MATYRLKRKVFTKWDETDTLKGMNDADILSQQQKKQNIGQNASALAGSAVKGALIGGAGAAAVGGLMGAKSAGAGFTNKMKGLGKGMGKGAKLGLAAGAAIGAVKAAGKINKQSQENAFYNDRLKYAQKQAMRREKKDWKTNMTQREGYSY